MLTYHSTNPYVHREGKVGGGEQGRETERPTNRQTNTGREANTERRKGRYGVTTKRIVRTRKIKS